MNLECVICAGRFIPSGDVYITPCGHMSHHICLLHWLKRSQTCPHCRKRCVESSLTKVYFNTGRNPVDTSNDVAKLFEKYDRLKVQAREQEISLTRKLQAEECKRKEQSALLKRVQNELKEAQKKQSDVEAIRQQLRIKESAILGLKYEKDIIKSDLRAMQKLEEELARLKPQIESYTKITKILMDAAHEEGQMLPSSPTKGIEVVDVAAALRSRLWEQERKVKLQSDQLESLRKDLSDERESRKFVAEFHSICDCKIYWLKEQLKQFTIQQENNSSAKGDSGLMRKECVSYTTGPWYKLASSMFAKQQTRASVTNLLIKIAVEVLHLFQEYHATGIDVD